MVLNLTVYTSLPPFISKTPVKLQYLKLFGEKKINFGLYFTENQQIWQNRNYDVIVTSYTGCLYFFFGMYGKKRPIAIPWYQISIPPGVYSSKIHSGLQQPPWIDVLKNSLVKNVRL